MRATRSLHSGDFVHSKSSNANNPNKQLSIYLLHLPTLSPDGDDVTWQPIVIELAPLSPSLFRLLAVVSSGDSNAALVNLNWLT